MICAKKYETLFKFVKVMTKILWPLLSGDGVYYIHVLSLFSDVSPWPWRVFHFFCYSL